jgi:hypothetical protein
MRRVNLMACTTPILLIRTYGRQEKLLDKREADPWHQRSASDGQKYTKGMSFCQSCFESISFLILYLLVPGGWMFVLLNYVILLLP